MYKSHSDIKELFDTKYVHISLVTIANRNLVTRNLSNKRPIFPEPLFLERYYKKRRSEAEVSKEDRIK